MPLADPIPPKIISILERTIAVRLLPIVLVKKALNCLKQCFFFCQKKC